MSKKKDEDSWRYGGIKRRDFRSAHDEPEVPRHKGKKNTKKWCKGKRGVEHVPVLREKTYKSNRDGQIRVMYRYNECEKCGKHLSYQWDKKF